MREGVLRKLSWSLGETYLLVAMNMNDTEKDAMSIMRADDLRKKIHRRD